MCRDLVCMWGAHNLEMGGEHSPHHRHSKELILFCEGESPDLLHSLCRLRKLLANPRNL
jgi:hypothetical protein